MDKIELEGELSDAASELKVWKDLKETHGWQRMQVMVQGQINARFTEYRKPLGSMDEVPAQEYLKGEMAGLELFSGLLDAEIERLEALIERLTKEIEDEPDTEDSATAGDAGGGDGLDLIDESRTDTFADGSTSNT